MSSSQNGLISRQFVFGEFVLYQDGALVLRSEHIHIPPKELTVLTLLLEAGGELVSKDDLLSRAWPDDDVNEESLTRCVYSLRRLLKETKSCRYIETIYGKGYRFCSPIATASRPALQTTQCSIAVLPFRTYPQLDAINLHHALVQCLSRYSTLGLIVLPATITQNCHNLTDIVELIDQLRPDYYLAGQTLPHADGWKLRVELVRSDNHQLVHQESIELSSEQPITLLQSRLVSLLSQRLPGLGWSQQRQLSELGSLDMAIVYLNSRHELQQHTPSSLRQALIRLRQCVNASPSYALPYCCLAECYLALANLGLFDRKLALIQAQMAIHKAIDIDPSHPQALGLLALLSSIQSQYAVAEVLFRQAWLLAPNSIELHYYQAWHLVLCGKLSQAQRALDLCLERDPTRIAAWILKLWLTYFEGRIDDAISLGQLQVCQYGQDHPVFQSVLALILAIQGRHSQANALVQAVRASGEECGLLAINHCYIDYCQHNEANLAPLDAFLGKINNHQAHAALLPLILLLRGRKTALKYWRRLERDDPIGLRIWCHDPRLRSLSSAALNDCTEAA
ncbi:transcriptional regulator [Chromobacterium amazonense]|uniref:Transcriptional regulator n=1 Tax=Chromobacterium amazonense TaxID=1382803 RepID=A0A2S9X5C3_9NEIS|nr:HilA/EilA family virulence transcriptional regulator [Chromobacterium amazonense]PRP70932.1 transcriptional regulator [Chromobacterium amazonense]